MTLGSRDGKPWALDEAESKPILKQALDCGGKMRIIALIDDVDVFERILKHLKVWDPQLVCKITPRHLQVHELSV